MASIKVDVPALLGLARLRAQVNSLRNIVSKSIAENVGYFIHGKTTLEKLPLALREMVLRELMAMRFSFNKQENVESMIQAYSQLVIPKTKKIDLNGFISMSDWQQIAQNTTKVLDVISHKAADLEHLYLHRNPFVDFPCFEIMSIGPLLRMANLKMIQFSSIEYSHVKRICKDLQKLQHVGCKNLIYYEEDEEEDIRANVEGFKSCFSRLRVFLFTATTCPFENELTKLCYQHLPKLEVVREFADTLKSSCITMDLMVPVETSALRHLRTAPSTIDLPAAFPNVTHLRVDCTRDVQEGQHDSILRFASIESLALVIRKVATSVSTLESFLDAYGANLHTLLIDSRNFLNFSFQRIFDACPKLQRLELCQMWDDDNQPIESFAQLREFHWTMGNSCNIFRKFGVTNILAAPNLEKLYLEDFENQLGVDELRKLTSLVADKKILRKLTSLSLKFGLMFNHHNNINFDLLRALRDFVAVAAVHLPNLAHFYMVLICMDHVSRGFIFYFSDEEEDVCSIGGQFQEWIGDGSIAEFIRLINARKQS